MDIELADKIQESIGIIVECLTQDPAYVMDATMATTKPALR